MEITTSNILFNGYNIDSMIFDRMGAEVVYRLLLDMGATKDIKLNWDEDTGKIHIMKKFVYSCGMVSTQDDDGVRQGDQYYTLQNYIKLLVRWDRAAYKRMKNVENKINQMHSAINSLNKQR